MLQAVPNLFFKLGKEQLRCDLKRFNNRLQVHKYSRQPELRTCGFWLKVDLAYLQSWALSVFFNAFNNKKLFFAFFYQVNLTGRGLFK